MSEEIEALERKIYEMKTQLAEMRRAQPADPIEDYELIGPNGPVKLSALFGEGEDLLVVHNMGTGCSYCTLWADGFNGFVPEISTRASFVLVSPDEIGVATKFAEKRGWRFPVVVDDEKAFSTAVGRWFGEKGIYPGVSGLHKDADGKITRISTVDAGPGDDFCAVWPLLDLLKDGAKGWEPKYRL